MLALIVSGGEFDPPVQLEQWRRRAAFVVAADSGAVHAGAMGLHTDLVVGDLDSIPNALRREMAAQGTEFMSFPAAKDETDTEIALRVALERGANELMILCALGGRLDHALANVFLLAMPGLEGRALLASGNVEVRLVTGEARFKGAPGDVLTLLPFAVEAQGVVTAGLAYPLKKETLLLGYARGVSNVFEGQEASVRLDSGRLLAIHVRQS